MKLLSYLLTFILLCSCTKETEIQKKEIQVDTIQQNKDTVSISIQPKYECDSILEWIKTNAIEVNPRKERAKVNPYFKGDFDRQKTGKQFFACLEMDSIKVENYTAQYQAERKAKYIYELRSYSTALLADVYTNNKVLLFLLLTGQDIHIYFMLVSALKIIKQSK